MRALFGKLSVSFVVSLFIMLTTSTAFSQAKSDSLQLREKIRKHIQDMRSEIKESEQGLERTVPARSVEADPMKSDEPRTVWVRCDQGDTIGKALKKNGNPLTIEVRGFCDEDVIINRDDVILRGADPLTDGVRGVGPGTSSLDGVIEVRDVRDVTIENLTVTGGDKSGIALDQAANIVVRNCQVRDNGIRGIIANFTYNISVIETIISHNGEREISAFNSRPLNCVGCTIDASQFGVIATASSVGLTSSSVTGPRSPISAFNSEMFVDFSVVRHTSTIGLFAIFAFDYAVISFGLSEIHGALGVDNAEMYLSNTTQLTNDVGGNAVTGSRMRLYGNSSLLATGPFGTFVDDFGTLNLNGASTINGNLDCFTGGDAFCEDPSNVSGTSTCGQCVKP